MRLKPFQSSTYSKHALSTGKFDSNRHRDGPKVSMAKRTSSPHAAAISSDDALMPRLSQRSPESGRMSAPHFSTTFGHVASSARFVRQTARTSSALPRYGPPAIGMP